MNFKDPITPEEKFILACDLIREYIAIKETIYEACQLLSLASKEEHGGERGLRYALGRMETKDNVLDFPLAFSLWRGFSVKMFWRVV